ncbi:amidohydrolase family-domain-containing protein [Cristinia sonorae]|uniref:Amidohydrolase family-domain-containing protein n=1 Tax=Cristinia sonorae TaxID=1940300 RepID=A0A8K0UFB0_9AGAR|nr:amidohydrolase family-domain-containing protein [Cristinia sonorae]
MSKRSPPKPKPTIAEKSHVSPSKPQLSAEKDASITSDWRRGLRVAIVLALLSAGFTAYRQFITTNTTQGRVILPESYALCTAERGKVYTVEEKAPNTDCILVGHDRVLAATSYESLYDIWEEIQDEAIRKFYGNEPKAKKALTVYSTPPGSIIVPGLADAHAHLIEYGFKVQLPLDTAQSLEDILDTLEDYVKAHPDIEADPDRWIRGMGWDQTRWKDWSGEFPTAEHLASRSLLAARPIALSRVDGHAMWVSPRVIELTKESQPGHKWPSDDEIEGGSIVRDSDGNPTGVFIDTAMDIIPVPPHDEEEMEEFALRAFNDALSVGLTSVHDASSMSSEMIDVYTKLADEGSLSIRVYAMASPETHSEKRLERYGEDGRLDVTSVKIFTDGALGSWGAALLEPYSDNPDTSGLMRTSEAKLEEIVKKVWDDGWQVNIHCIGDRANKAVLDIYERLLSNSSDDALQASTERRPRIEHAQIMQVEDLARAGKLGVITSVQPTHATSDMWYAETRLGPDRIKGAYAYQTLLQSSPRKVLPLGSDFPVEGINPLLGFYASTTRLDVHGNSPHGDKGWYTSERLTRMQALKGMTLDAAYAAFAETDWGSLARGKKADFVVLDRDIMDEEAVPAAAILETKVLATVVDGRVAFGKL